ncbi:mechanosensitive ion channel protein [Leptolyngbya sp. Heron Island J]|nr:mechanosensitive ion channel protein [Leptolyngbya sp. Heron Island J]
MQFLAERIPMNEAFFTNIASNATSILIGVGLKLVGALIFWIVGRWLIKFAIGLLTRSLKKTTVDPTLVIYLKSTVGVLLNVVLVVAILGFFGIETTSFAALLAAAGIAIGAAWSGLLAHFAAGAFLVILRPFKVGDFVTAGGVTGTVEEVGLFVTKINTMDNVMTIVGNNTIFSDTIQNFTTNPYRRVDLVAQLDNTVEPSQAIALLKEKLAEIPNVMTEPAPDVEILEFNPMGPVLAVRPYCNNNDYWQVYFDTNKVIRQGFGQAGFPAPAQHFTVHQRAA